MVRLHTGDTGGSRHARQAWRSRILRAAVVVMLPILPIGCAQTTEKQTAEFGKLQRWLQSQESETSD